MRPGRGLAAQEKEIQELRARSGAQEQQAADLKGTTKGLEGKVSAVAGEIGLVVLSIGRESGVVEGDVFRIVRDGAAIAQVKIDRADARWSAGKIIDSTKGPRTGDGAIRLDGPPEKR